jgi:hypothetical protein
VYRPLPVSHSAEEYGGLGPGIPRAKYPVVANSHRIELLEKDPIMKTIVATLSLLMISTSALASPPENVMNEIRMSCSTGTLQFTASLKQIVIGEGIGNTREENRLIENTTGVQVTHIVEQGGSCLSLSCPTAFENQDSSVTIWADGYVGKLGKRAEVRLGALIGGCDVEEKQVQGPQFSLDSI